MDHDSPGTGAGEAIEPTITTHRIVPAVMPASPPEPERVALVVTSPPYPMIGMWDEIFARQSPEIAAALDRDDGRAAFDLMHAVLDPVWTACVDSLRDGGFICVNVGDAVRTCDGVFQLFSNHTRIIAALQSMGLTLLPSVIWRKPANSPTKFMGSGMLPAGAYVTREHEYIIIARKGRGGARPGQEARAARRRSAVFWEERNTWYSDLWQVTGARQEMSGINLRTRSAAFPLEIPYRLIAMYSVMGDLVVDPFAGTGTTNLAAMALARDSLGFELDAELCRTANKRLTLSQTKGLLTERSRQRLLDHQRFSDEKKGSLKHAHARSDAPVTTTQETDLLIPFPASVRLDDANGTVSVSHDYRAPGELLGLVDGQGNLELF